MTLEVLKALAVILEFCLNQDSCKNCPMAQFCQKMPCEWQLFPPIVINRRFPWSRFSHEPRSLEFIYQNARNYFLKEIGFKWAHHDSRKTTRVDGPCFWSRILFHYYGKGWQKIYLYRLWLR